MLRSFVYIKLTKINQRCFCSSTFQLLPSSANPPHPSAAVEEVRTTVITSLDAYKKKTSSVIFNLKKQLHAARFVLLVLSLFPLLLVALTYIFNYQPLTSKVDEMQTLAELITANLHSYIPPRYSSSSSSSRASSSTSTTSSSVSPAPPPSSMRCTDFASDRDILVPLPNGESAGDYAQRLFAKARKMRKSIPLLQSLLLQVGCR